MSKYLVLRDTNEHEGKGWIFSANDWCAGTVKKNLYTGDYSLEGFYDNKILVIERKGAVAEFVANLTDKERWDDFKQVLERMEEFKWAYLVLEFPLAALTHFPEGSGIPKGAWSKLRVTAQFLIKRLAEIDLRFKTKIIFADRDAKPFVSSLFKRVMEHEAY